MADVVFRGSGAGWRHVVTALGFLGFVVVYILRVNLSVGLVAMVNHNTTADTVNVTGDSCLRDLGPVNTTSAQKDGEFNWDSNTQGLILGAFFYGYILTQIPGGWVAQRFGAKWVFGLGTLWTALLTLVTPLVARLGVPYFVALRVLEGVGEGVTFPAMNAMFSRWAPPNERSRLPAFTYSGSYFGTVFSFIVSGYLCQSDFLGGWPSVFYVFGAVGIVWFIFWALLTTSSPNNHPFISEDEKAYIASSVQKEDTVKASRPPWGKILTSMPVWAIVVSHTSHNWGFYTLLTELPTFLKDILGFDIKSNGLISAIPYVAQFFIQNLTGFGADWLRKRKGWTDVTVLRKVVDCTGHLIPGLCLIGAGYVGCNSVAAISLLVLSVGMSGLNGGGFLVNHLDIAPQYAGVLFGLSNSVATIPGFLGPLVVGAITKNNNTVGAWREVFYLTSGIYFFSVVFYAIFASGKIQPWAEEEGEDRSLAKIDEESEEED